MSFFSLSTIFRLLEGHDRARVPHENPVDRLLSVPRETDIKPSRPTPKSEAGLVIHGEALRGITHG